MTNEQSPLPDEKALENAAELFGKLDEEKNPYKCGRCGTVLESIEELLLHSKVGGECAEQDAADEYEEAILSKRNIKQIARRSGKTQEQLELTRQMLLGMGHGMKIRYKVVKADPPAKVVIKDENAVRVIENLEIHSVGITEGPNAFGESIKIVKEEE